jgi:hypothetical protein
MVASGDQSRPRGRAQRGRMKLVVAQPHLGDAIKRWRRNDTAKGSGNAITGVVGHYQQHIGCTFGRNDARRPPRLRIHRAGFDHSAEFQCGWRQCFRVWKLRGARRARNAIYLLSVSDSRRRQTQYEGRCELRDSMNETTQAHDGVSLAIHRSPCRWKMMQCSYRKPSRCAIGLWSNTKPGRAEDPAGKQLTGALQVKS